MRNLPKYKNDLKFIAAISSWESNLRKNLENCSDGSNFRVRWDSLSELSEPINEYLNSTYINCDDVLLREARIELLTILSCKINMVTSASISNPFEDELIIKR